jgi:hypothetical protein
MDNAECGRDAAEVVTICLEGFAEADDRLMNKEKLE